MRKADLFKAVARNALSPILVTLSGIFIESSEEQPQNASFPIAVTDFGIIIDSNDIQLRKASFPG